jgi:hypothetical protein
MALIYGALLLHEPVELNAIGGLVLVLTGIFVMDKKTELRTTNSSAKKTIVRE